MVLGAVGCLWRWIVSAEVPAGGAGEQTVEDVRRIQEWDDLRALADEVFAEHRRESTGETEVGLDDPVVDGGGGADAGRTSDPGSSVQRLEDAFIGEWISGRYLQGRFLFTAVFGWVKFDGRRWVPVVESVVAEVIRRALIDFHTAQAEARADPKRLQEISRLLSASRIRALTFIAKLGLTTDRQFDGHPHLLNVANGVVDLRNGVLLEHDPELMFTKLARVNYRPGARHPDWDQALAAVRADVAEWLQTRFGQGITGEPVSDDKLMVLMGGGSNGKTCLVDAIRCSVGPDYAVAMPERVLLARQGEHPTELMVLHGARLALMEEFPELGHLNVKRTKDLLGTGEMTARYCGKDTVAWKPTHTPVVTTNYLPRVDESDNGTWRRLVMVDFPYTFVRQGAPLKTPAYRHGDHRLRERLREGRDGQHEAVLAWLVEGAVRWYRNGRELPDDPPSVQETTQRWRKNSDVLLRFIDERLVFDPQAQVVATELFEDFNQWLQSNGHKSWSDQSFSARLAQHGQAIANDVAKKRSRRSSALRLSRRTSRLLGATGATTGSAVPKQFTAWVGIRFQTEDDQEPGHDHA